LSGIVFDTPASAQTKPSPAAVLPTSQAVKSCLNNRQSAECLDNLFAEALKRHSTLEILHLLQRYEQEDPELRRDCHPVVHAVAQKCELVSHENRLACMRGAVYALIDNTWDGRYALPFCATFNQENDQNACVRISAEYLKATFEKSPGEIARECDTHFREPARCAALASR
jgi:hypothetical protein